MRNWSTYLLKCADNSLYCGVTKNIENRLAQHKAGTASKYTRSRIPVELYAVRSNLTKSEAFQLEYRVKKYPADKKVSLLENWGFES